MDSGEVAAISPLGAVELFDALNAFGGDQSVIAAGPDGALWFTEPQAGNIGRVDTNGNVFELRLPTADAYPTGLAVGPDGAIWFSEPGAIQIGRLVPGSP